VAATGLKLVMVASAMLDSSICLIAQYAGVHSVLCEADQFVSYYYLYSMFEICVGVIE
jgi:hypothetical protein